MEICVLTIRDKQTKELLYAQGSMDISGEYYPQINFKPEWFSEEEKQGILKKGSWHFSNYDGAYNFNEEVRHIEGSYEKVIIAHETLELN